MNDLWTKALWSARHSHSWMPLLLVAGVFANAALLKGKWPNLGQWMHLFACTASLVGAGHVWFDAASKVEDSSSWGQVLGALSMILITIDSGSKVLREIVIRKPDPPPSS